VGTAGDDAADTAPVAENEPVLIVGRAGQVLETREQDAVHTPRVGARGLPEGILVGTEKRGLCVRAPCNLANVAHTAGTQVDSDGARLGRVIQAVGTAGSIDRAGDTAVYPEHKIIDMTATFQVLHTAEGDSPQVLHVIERGGPG